MILFHSSYFQYNELSVHDILQKKSELSSLLLVVTDEEIEYPSKDGELLYNESQYLNKWRGLCCQFIIFSTIFMFNYTRQLVLVDKMCLVHLYTE